MTAAPSLRVALAQLHCPWADSRGNLERMAAWAERARGEGAEIVLMPHAWDSDALDEDGQVIDYHAMEEIVAYRRRTGRMRWKTHDQMRDDFYAYIPGLARESRFFALFVNQSGRPHECLQFVGPSFVVDPTGRVVAETPDGDEQLVLATV